jgi:hypothetical protein
MWRVRARGRARKAPGTMNRLEAAYAQQLKLRQVAGEVEWFAYEALKLRLAPKTFLTVDFFVMLANGSLEAHEVKGNIEDDAAVKLKVAATLYPFRFVLVRATRGQWDLTEIAAA